MNGDGVSDGGCGGGVGGVGGVGGGGRCYSVLGIMPQVNGLMRAFELMIACSGDHAEWFFGHGQGAVHQSEPVKVRR